MDERLLAGPVVEGVCPAAVRAGRACERLAAHLLCPRARVDDGRGKQAAGAEVIGTDAVFGRVERGRVLDQVERRPARRDRVEAEVPVQGHDPARAQLPRVHHSECRLGAREVNARLDQDERPTVAREPARGSVVGDGGNGEGARKERRSKDAAAVTAYPRNYRACACRNRHIASLAGRRDDAGRADVDAEHRQPVRPGGGASEVCPNEHHSCEHDPETSCVHLTPPLRSCIPGRYARFRFWGPRMTSGDKDRAVGLNQRRVCRTAHSSRGPILGSSRSAPAKNQISPFRPSLWAARLLAEVRRPRLTA